MLLKKGEKASGGVLKPVSYVPANQSQEVIQLPNSERWLPISFPQQMTIVSSLYPLDLGSWKTYLTLN